MASNHDDRRKEPRLDVNIQVDYKARDMFISNYVTNISKGGVFIQTDSPLPIHSEIQVTFSIPETGRTITAKGKVAWTYDIKKGSISITPGMGIRFTDLSMDNRKILEDYIRNLTSMSGIDH